MCYYFQNKTLFVFVLILMKVDELGNTNSKESQQNLNKNQDKKNKFCLSENTIPLYFVKDFIHDE